MHEHLALLGVAAALLLPGCAHYPLGPSVMVLPGNRKTLAQFQADDVLCRNWAARQSGASPQQAATENGVGSAAVGTAVGAAAGAAIGAASGNPGAGAAIGAGSGLLAGSFAGLQRSESAGSSVQSRYDNAYLQCMYASGDQIPLPRDAFAGQPPGPYASPAPGAPWPAPGSTASPPPPPAGAPPPPPPDAG